MFDTEFSHSWHCATSGSSSATFHGSFTETEGPENANQFATSIKITLGRMNSIQFFTTPFDSLLAEIPRPKNESTLF